MINLPQHCANIGLLINTIIDTDPSRLEPIYSWLKLASGLKSLTYDASLFDDGCGCYCNAVSIYDGQLENLQEMFVKNLTIFLFIWNAIEALYELIQPQKLLKQDGKINRLCSYISNTNPDEIYVKKYRQTLSALYKTLTKTDWNLGSILTAKPHFISIDSYGLYLTYKIRCEAVHGENLPPTDLYSYSGRLSGASVFHLASRVALLTIQKSMICWAINNEYTVDDRDCIFTEEGGEFDFIKEIQSTHLPTHTSKEYRCSLFQT